MILLFSGCDLFNSGTITVTISNASSFNGHRIFFTIYDDDSRHASYDFPTGNIEGRGYFNVQSGSGSFTAVGMDGSFNLDPKAFDGDRYYIIALADLDDDAGGFYYKADAGDKVTDFIEVRVRSDVTIEISESDFIYTITSS